jgi:hypothetical protein
LVCGVEAFLRGEWLIDIWRQQREARAGTEEKGEGKGNEAGLFLLIPSAPTRGIGMDPVQRQSHHHNDR